MPILTSKVVYNFKEVLLFWLESKKRLPILLDPTIAIQMMVVKYRIVIPEINI